MNSELQRIIETYDFSTLKDELEKSKTVENIYIGVLGEFSSGKSSLLNSILHKKILPAMDKPTTKSITYIKSDESQETEVEYFEILQDETEQKISIIDFQDIAKGNTAGEAIVSVKKNDFLSKGYVFVDTPGVSSFDKMDIDITYGMLPKLDGVLICIDCNTGTLNASLKAFLESPEIIAIKDKILFVLTKSDSKINEQSIDKIITGFKEDISKYLHIDDIENRIISFSANDFLENNDSRSNDKLLNLFDVSINARRQHMISQRLKSQEEILQNKILEALKDLKEKLNFDDSQFKEERLKLEDEIEILKKEKSNISKKISKFEDLLYEEVKLIGANFTALIKAECSAVSPDLGILSEIYSQYTANVNDMIETSVERFFKNYEGIKTTNIQADFSNLNSSINLIVKSKNVITTLTTAGILALVTGGTSVAANAAEATVATSAGLGGQAASKVVANETAKIAAKEVGKAVVKNGLKANLLRGVAFLNNTVKEINPIEHIGSYLANLKIKSKTDLEISQIGRKIATSTIDSIKDKIDIIFEDIEEKIKLSDNNLNTAFEKLKKGTDDVENTKRKIQTEIIKLS